MIILPTTLFASRARGPQLSARARASDLDHRPPPTTSMRARRRDVDLLSRALASTSSSAVDRARALVVPRARTSSSSSTSSANDAPRLLRHHLHDALYAPRTGYFTRDARRRTPVGRMEDGAIDFRALRGQDDYFDELNRRYAKLGAQWLTPGEIFSPYYADAVVNYVLETHRGDEDEDEGLETLRVYEIGGGTGTFATGFLDAVRRRAPKVYEKMRYTSIDISKTLVDAQSARVRAGAGDAARRDARCSPRNRPSRESTGSPSTPGRGWTTEPRSSPVGVGRSRAGFPIES